MKTLLQINSVINTGSTGRIAEGIGQKAISAGWQSYIAYGRENKRPSQSHKIRIGNDWDIRLHGLQTRLLDNHSLGLSSRSATKILISQIEEIKPDIIHLHNIHGYYLNIEILFDYLASQQIPIVWTLHDCWPFTGHCCYFDFVGCEKWKTQCNKCPQTRTYPASFLIDRSTQNFRFKKELFTGVKNLTIVPVSQWLAKLVEQSFLFSHKVQIINNGIDTSVFSPSKNQALIEKYQLKGKFVVLGVASGWGPRKGLNDFLKLARIIDTNYQIILVGLNASQLKQLPANIIGISKTENVQELADLYSVADVFANPTWEDNFPTTNLESMSCGTPVITYKTGGSPESIDSKTGIVVEKGNLNDLHAAILKIQKNGKAFYSTACRERAVKNYNKDDRFGDYIKLYESLLAEKS